MAVTRAGSVIRVAADNDTVAGPLTICGIKYIAGTGSPTAAMKDTDTNGVIMWETTASASIFEEVELRTTETIHFDLAGTGTVVYLYTEV